MIDLIEINQLRLFGHVVRMRGGGKIMRSGTLWKAGETKWDRRELFNETDIEKTVKGKS